MHKKIRYLGSLFSVIVMMFLFGDPHANASVRNSNVQVSDVGSDNKIDYGNTARKLAVSSDGTIYAAFYGSNGIRVARSLDQGGSFQPSIQVSAVNRQPEIAVSSNDVLYVTWTDENGDVWLSRSTDKGVTFSSPQNIGNSDSRNASAHMSTFGNYLYILPQNGRILFISKDNGQQFSTYTFSDSFAFSDVHVDSRTGNVYLQKDRPDVYYFKSTDYGATFGPQQNGGGSIFYSVGTLSSGQNGTYLFVAGQSPSALRINLEDNTSSMLSFPNSTFEFGRSVIADEYGNIVTGYTENDKVYYSTSNDLGNTFNGKNEVATTNMSNIGINPTNGDIMFLYAANGQVYLTSFEDELRGYTPNLSKGALYFDSSNMQQSVTITNTSLNPIAIENISLSGEFTKTTTCGGTLNSNESCQVTVNFSPTSFGSKTGTLSITTSASNSPRTVSLFGTLMASSNAGLSNITLNPGILTPAFDAGTLTYTSSVAHAVISVDITPTVADATATLKVNGTAVTSGNAVNVPLLVGSNTITTEVTAQDGTTTKTYTVAVDRADLAPTGTTVSSSANPSPFGETVTLTANVTAASGTPTGTVTFYHGSDEIGNVPVSDGQAELTLSSLEGGTYSIHAVYSGDADFAGSQSGIMTQEITPAFTTVGLTASSTKIKPGQSVTLTVGVDSPAGTPSGTVNFMEGSNELGEVDVDSSGEASITLSSLSHGEHTIHAVYSGSANFSANHSDDLKVIVNTAPDAQEEEYSLITGSTLDIAGPGLLEEATDAEDDWLTAKVGQDPDHGTVSILENGGFTYTPDTDFRGEDSFTYVAYDGWQESSPATVTLYVYDGLQIGKGTANPGERVSIPVSMTSQGHVAGLQFDISYDHDLLNLEELTAGTLLEDSSLEFSSNELSNGNTRVIVANIDNVNIPEGIGGLLDLTFLVDSEAYSGQQSILKILNPKIVDASVTHATYDEPSVTDLTYNYLYVDGLFTVVDTIDPTLTLTPSPTTWTKQDVVIQVDANGTGSAIKVKKWAVGEKDAAYFAEEGTEFSTGSFSVSENGTYTVFVEDDAGNTTTQTVEITNIDKESPTLSFTKSLDATEKAVHIQVTGNGTGSQIIEWKYAQGIQTVDYFAGQGTDFTNTFDITENVPYTIYAKDEAGNTVVKTIYVMGDNSGDYIVDVTDWVATINYVLERTIPTEAQKLVTDMNRDGDINIMDPVMIANVIMSGGYPE